MSNPGISAAETYYSEETAVKESMVSSPADPWKRYFPNWLMVLVGWFFPAQNICNIQTEGRALRDLLQTSPAVSAVTFEQKEEIDVHGTDSLARRRP